MTTTVAGQDETADAGNDRERSSEGLWRRPWPVVLPTVVVLLHAARYGEWIEDDGGITFAYARSLTSGAGLVLQPDAPPVEGFSDPLWLGVLALGRLLGLFDRGTWFGVPDLVAFPKLVALLCCAGMVACFHVVARRVTPWPARVTAVAGTVTACVPSFVVWCFSGLENPLYALLVVGLAAALATAALDGTLVTHRTAALCGLLAAGAVLTRPDGLVYTVAFPAVLVAMHRADLRAARSTVLRYVAAVAVPTAAYLILRLVVFGDWLPTTARAKEQGLPALSDFNRPVQLVVQGGWLLLLVATVAVVLIVGRGASPMRTTVTVLLLPMGLAALAFAVLGADWMPQARFATPFWPLAALVGTLSVVELREHLAARGRALTTLLVVAALAISAAGWVADENAILASPTAPLCRVARITGFKINSYADRLGVRQGSLLGVDAGGTSLTSRLRFVDYAGLTDPTIARFRQKGDGRGLRDYLFDVVRPTFMRVGDVFPGEARSQLLTDPRLARDYVPIEPGSPHLVVAVRRDAIGDPARLADVRAFAERLGAQNTRDYAAGGGDLGWSCPSVLRPGPLVP